MLNVRRGLGALIAEKFGAEGCNVAINYAQSKDRAEALAEKIEKEHGVKTLVLQGVLSERYEEAEVYCR